MVRQCGNNDWGSHCGDIKYLIDEATEKSESIKGCLESCDTDGCNGAHAHNQYLGVVITIFALISIAMIQR